MGGDRGSAGDHPLLITLMALAAVATILTFLLQLGTISLPDLGGVVGRSCDDPAISLSDGSGPSGTEVVVSGSGFFPDAAVDLSFHTDSLAPARTDGEGRFEATVVIPGTLDPFAPMQSHIMASTGGCWARTPFQLTG